MQKGKDMERYFRRSALEDMLGLSRSTIYRMMNDGEFPRPVVLGRRAVGWRAADVETWIKQREEAAND